MIPAVLFLVANTGQSSSRRRRPTGTIAGVALFLLVWLTIHLSTFRSVEWYAHRRSENHRRAMTQWYTKEQHLIASAEAPHSAFRWETDNNDLVHIVTTRFMQYQSRLLHLGRARIDLFRTITLPSMLRQSTQQFLWIIRVDPSLPDEFRKELLKAMESMDNMIVLLSNYNADDFRQHGMKHISLPQVLGRSVSDQRQRFRRLTEYHKAAQTRIVLESRLDADDALSRDVLEQLQRQARERLSSSTDQSGFMIWCLATHMEWQFYNPLDTTNKESGSLVALPYRHCVTPGLTFAYHLDATADSVPTHKHHQLRNIIPACPTDKSARNNCLVMLKRSDKRPQALRARTPTSAGMMNMLLLNSTDGKDGQTLHQASKWSHLQEQAWVETEQLFGVQKDAVVQMRKRLETDITLIAKENALGQCTPGHSCKPSSQKILAKLQKQPYNQT